MVERWWWSRLHQASIFTMLQRNEPASRRRSQEYMRQFHGSDRPFMAVIHEFLAGNRLGTFREMDLAQVNPMAAHVIKLLRLVFDTAALRGSVKMRPMQEG